MHVLDFYLFLHIILYKHACIRYLPTLTHTQYRTNMYVLDSHSHLFRRHVVQTCIDTHVYLRTHHIA